MVAIGDSIRRSHLCVEDFTARVYLARSASSNRTPVKMGRACSARVGSGRKLMVLCGACVIALRSPTVVSLRAWHIVHQVVIRPTMLQGQVVWAPTNVERVLLEDMD